MSHCQSMPPNKLLQAARDDALPPFAKASEDRQFRFAVHVTCSRVPGLQSVHVIGPAWLSSSRWLSAHHDV